MPSPSAPPLPLNDSPTGRLAPAPKSIVRASGPDPPVTAGTDPPVTVPAIALELPAPDPPTETFTAPAAWTDAPARTKNPPSADSDTPPPVELTAAGGAIPRVAPAPLAARVMSAGLVTGWPTVSEPVSVTVTGPPAAVIPFTPATEPMSIAPFW